MRLILVAIALLCTAFVAADASACCGQTSTAYYAPAYTTGYAPAYTTAYAPATYSTNYGGGWYPGYWWDRTAARVWGYRTDRMRRRQNWQRNSSVSNRPPLSRCQF